jgi:hypothetical protein
MKNQAQDHQDVISLRPKRASIFALGAADALSEDGGCVGEHCAKRARIVSSASVRSKEDVFSRSQSFKELATVDELDG